MPGEGIGRPVSKAAHAHIQPDGGAGGELHGEVLRLHLDGLLFMRQFDKFVLGESLGPSLQSG